jgi:SAM-dependent methyltransferase
MADTTRHDAWQAGNSYDAYMGRWSRQIAPRFLDWLDAPGGMDWIDVGCGTGALTAAILTGCMPRRVTSIDPSEGFLATARANCPSDIITFRIGDAQALPAETGSVDVVVSALVLNFVPDRGKALAEMKRVCRPGGKVGFYVWDYPGGGVGFMSAFWDAAAALDPAARDLAETRRFPFCTQDKLTNMAEAAGLTSVRSTGIEAPSVFKDFDDLWQPFTLGAGPAPGYCAALAAPAREKLRQRLSDSLPRRGDGSIALSTRAWAIKGSVG